MILTSKDLDSSIKTSQSPLLSLSKWIKKEILERKIEFNRLKVRICIWFVAELSCAVVAGLLQGSESKSLEPHIKYNFTTTNWRVEIWNNNETRCLGWKVTVIVSHSFFGASLKIYGIPFLLPVSHGTSAGFIHLNGSANVPLPLVFCSFRKLYTRSLPASKQPDACNSFFAVRLYPDLMEK